MTGFSSVVLTARRFSDYDDAPGERYHFPRRNYESAVREAYGRIVLMYEPRRGGTSVGKLSGGRMAFFAWAVLGRIEPDPLDPSHAYVPFTAYAELPRLVPLRETGFDGHKFQSAVSKISDVVVELVLNLGMTPILGADRDAPGLTDRSTPADWPARPMQELVLHKAVRDRSFRFRVVEEAYSGRCALTGLRLTNGNGRAEVDAAHIRPVEMGGPDLVSNGFAITKTLHWAFDRGLITVKPDHRIETVERGLDSAVLALLPKDGLAIVPLLADHRPHPQFLAWHNENVFEGAL